MPEYSNIDWRGALEGSIAHLPSSAQAEVHALVQQALDANPNMLRDIDNPTADDLLNQLPIDQMISQAEQADAADKRANDDRIEQVKAVDAGDFAGAEEFVVKAREDLAEAADKGGPALSAVAADQVMQADADRPNIQYGELHQEIALDQTHAALEAAADGDADHALVHAQDAAEHSTFSSDYAGASDHGGAEAAAATDAHDSAATEAASSD
jgi:hypothetical protein